MFYGWIWKSDCIPVSGGGVPPDIPRIEVKLTFSDGGMMEFNEAYIRLRERIFQWQEMRRESGPGADVPDEPLPAYAGPSDPPPVLEPQEANTSTAEEASTRDAGAQQRPMSLSNRPAPDEPPPDYEEAQAQQISIRLEDHIREEADHGDSRNQREAGAE
jgi:WW domain-binding protein 2